MKIRTKIDGLLKKIETSVKKIDALVENISVSTKTVDGLNEEIDISNKRLDILRYDIKGFKKEKLKIQEECQHKRNTLVVMKNSFPSEAYYCDDCDKYLGTNFNDTWFTSTDKMKNV